jgi:N-sulfoglucosamine sulfohydrolase
MRLLLTFVAAIFAWAVPARPVAAQERPRNVVIIIADDLGLDLGCYGNKVIRTPNLDALAKRGIRFSHGYATTASCSPSRSVILTGLHTHTSGQYGLQHQPHTQQTNDWVQSLPSLLRAAGYFTGLIGKFHVGPDAVYPFESLLTKVNARSPTAMAKAAREFLNQKGKRPFFLVYGFTDPHRAKKGFANEGFADDPAEVRYDPKDIIVPYHLPDGPEVRRELAEYCQSVSRMDRGVGLLLELLRETGQLDDTLIIFLSDNGIPFPGAKTTQYAAGLHLPLIMSSPMHKGGHTNNALASWVDIAPTVLDWSKVKGPKYKLPGRSLLPILDQENPQGWERVFGSHQFHEITMYYPMRSVTTPKHKYILNLAHKLDYPFASDLWGSAMWQGVLQRQDKMMGQRSVKAYLYRPKEELYDLEKDPNELKNLASDPAYGEVLAELRRDVRAFQAETNDPWTILYREEKGGSKWNK